MQSIHNSDKKIYLPNENNNESSKKKTISSEEKEKIKEQFKAFASLHADLNKEREKLNQMEQRK